MWGCQGTLAAGHVDRLRLSLDPLDDPLSDDPLTTCRKIVNWRLFLKFPDEVAVSGPAKDLITRLMCDVDDRLGTLGVHEIKVRSSGCVVLGDMDARH